LERIIRLWLHAEDDLDGMYLPPLATPILKISIATVLGVR
jgi:hypothetical protein